MLDFSVINKYVTDNRIIYDLEWSSISNVTTMPNLTLNNPCIFFFSKWSSDTFTH